MSSSCSQSLPTNSLNSVRHSSMRCSLPLLFSTTHWSRGKPNISPAGLCASARPSLWSRILSPGIIGLLEYRAGRHEPRCVTSKDAVGRGHNERSGDALVSDVAGDERDLAVGQREEIVEIAADRARRPVVSCEAPSRKCRQLLREELLLNHPCGAQLLCLPRPVFLRPPQLL